MRILINDEPREFPEGVPVTVADLLAGVGLPSLAGVAVAVNETVTPRSAWATSRLAQGDRVTVIRATQGG